MVNRTDPVSSLVTQLTKARSFEEAATISHRVILSCAQELLADSRYRSRARLLRCVAHLRPSGSYQRLFGIDFSSGESIEGIGYLTSAGVWRWVEEHGCSVSIDIQLSTLQAWLTDDPLRHPEGAPDANSPAGKPGDESRIRMLNRDSTHVHVVPLCLPGGAVHGMIAIEARCKQAMGKEFIWGDGYELFEVLASVAAPYLSALPSEKVDSDVGAQLSDALLPVVGRSTASLIKLLAVFAQQQETILISGPTGSGKSRLARWCHAQSPYSDHPFETLDLLSVPEELQMAELFGWRRGAFTGAVKDNPGALVRAAGGTLFIDEIDKLSLKAQAGLLRVLEEQRYRPLGDDGEEQRADVRFLIGTNTDLRAAVQQGRFREDLYYRIHVLPVRLPPLAERLDELPQWADFMLQRRHANAAATTAARLTPAAVERLMIESWPGNLRQLDNLIRRAYVFALASLDVPDDDLVLQRQHVERALSFETQGHAGPEDDAPLALLWRAACALAGQAERREGSAPAVTLELSGGFRGLVLLAAEQRLGSREQAFKQLGEQGLVDNRNHHRAYRRELERTRALVEAVGGQVNDELAALLAATSRKTGRR